jgi:hypothetical protein
MQNVDFIANLGYLGLKKAFWNKISHSDIKRTFSVTF